MSEPRRPSSCPGSPIPNAHTGSHPGLFTWAAVWVLTAHLREATAEASEVRGPNILAWETGARSPALHLGHVTGASPEAS